VIFLTVGTGLPFNRLVQHMDTWAEQHDDQPIFAQLGDLKPSDYRPEHMEWTRVLPAREFDVACDLADIIVAHAGMGSILAALTVCKPIVILPRKAALGEQLNGHQLATAQRFVNRPGVFVAWDETELPQATEQALVASEQLSAQLLQEFAPSEFTGRLRGFIIGKADN
jgi:UDP-N-acetylglucosamine transferase subunit ALG13